jgi:hypothetical protein
VWNIIGSRTLPHRTLEHLDRHCFVHPPDAGQRQRAVPAERGARSIVGDRRASVAKIRESRTCP